MHRKCFYNFYPILFSVSYVVSCAAEETNLRLSPSAKQSRYSFSGLPPVYQDLRTRHDWLLKKAIVDLPIRMKGNSKCTSSNSLSPLGSQRCFADVTKAKINCVCDASSAAYIMSNEFYSNGHHVNIPHSLTMKKVVECRWKTTAKEEKRNET